jgi:hypothetical protein
VQLTPIFSFKKPTDTDYADFRVFVGDNLELIETAISGRLTSADADAKYSLKTHSHSWGQITGKPTVFAPSTHSHSWTEITGKPTTFSPSSHRHTWLDLDNIPTTFTPSVHTHTWDEITGKPTYFEHAPHSHSWEEIEGTPTYDNYQGWNIKIGATTDRISSLQTVTLQSTGQTTIAYDSTTNTLTFNTPASSNFYLTGVTGSANGTATFTREGLPNLTWSTSHSHSWTSITGKPSTFSPSTHTHSWTEITGKPTTFAPSTHSHSWNDITSKPTSFAPTPHSHGWEEIISKPTVFNPASHSHPISQITGLQAELDTKLEFDSYATYVKAGTVRVGNGLAVNVDGYIFAKLGDGLELDALNQITTQTASFVKKGTIIVGSDLTIIGDYLNVGSHIYHDLTITGGAWTTLTVESTGVGMDGVLELKTISGTWAIRNDESATNTLDYRFNNVSKIVMYPTGDLKVRNNLIVDGKVSGNLYVEGEIQLGQRFSVTNPNNALADVSLDFDATKDMPRIRYGGTGAGAENGFEIQGSGNSVKFKIDNTGNVDVMDSLRVMGTDIKLGYGNTARGDTGGSRALVKTDGGKLTINYNWEFFGGIKIGSGINHIFDKKAHAQLPLLNGWRAYGGGYDDPTYTKFPTGLVILKGLIDFGTAKTYMAQLPVGCRPNRRRIFFVYSYNGVARLDLLDDGRLQMITGGVGWVSLDTISFLAEK